MGGAYQKTLKALEYDKVLEELSNFSRCDYSKELCLDLTPDKEVNTIQTMLNYTKEALNILDNALDIPLEYVINIKDIDLKPEYFIETELIDFAKTIRSSRLVKNFIKENSSQDSLLFNTSLKLYTNKELEDKINDTFDENYNVRQNATPTLSGLYSSLKDTESSLKETVTKLLNSPEFNKHLQEQIYTVRDDRIVFQVKAPDKNKVSGIVHDVSATNKTFYIEPNQIVPLNNKIREVKAKIHGEIINILISLSKDIKADIDEIKNSIKTLGEIDFHFAKARYAIKTHAAEPTLEEKKIIKIERMRHPLLIGRVEKLVENDFEIGKDYHSVLITGSNTGGKTVAMKTIGLFLLMAKSGMFLPCAEAHIYPFKNVFADIGDDQNILQNLSTFSSHMTNIIDILNLSNSDTFVLIDELCAGTDPVEGAVLAEVILKRLKQLSSKSVITTHYGELKSLEYSDSYFKNACVEFDTETLSPTYNLIIGIPGLSNAIAVSSNLGLDKSLVKQAQDLLYNQKDNSLEVVERLQDTHQQLTKNLKSAEETNAEAIDLKKKYEKEVSELKKSKNKTIKHIKNRFDNELDAVKAEIKEILDELRKNQSEKIARRSYLRLANLEHKFRGELSELEESEKYDEINWDNAKIHDIFIVKELNQEVELLSLPDKNKNVFVQMGNIKTKIKQSKLAVYNKALIKKSVSKPVKPSTNFELKRYAMSNSLDLRGFRVEEALDELEAYLDKASLVNLTPVFIIHGHGTGALKSAVRDFLSTSPYVAKYRVGENAEGGDGVSVVDIN
ncbi:MAG: endonuclease MutS2 [Candidatus Gastranaerophilales bacterium]|nr:endonuclease MutS2 [Candidatus Gastranaerophilales bacterium]